MRSWVDWTRMRFECLCLGSMVVIATPSSDIISSPSISLYALRADSPLFPDTSRGAMLCSTLLICCMCASQIMLRYMVLAMVVPLAYATGAVIELTGQTPRVIYGQLDSSDALTLTRNTSEDKLVCSGEFEAADLRIAGTTTTVADLIDTVSMLGQRVAAIESQLPPPPPPELAYQVVAYSCLCHNSSGVLQCMSHLHDDDERTHWNPVGCSRYHNNWYLIYEANANVTFSTVRLQSIYDLGHGVQQYTFYTCSSADDSTCTGIGQSCTGNRFCNLPPYVPTQWWKIRITSTEGGWQPYVTEIDFI